MTTWSVTTFDDVRPGNVVEIEAVIDEVTEIGTDKGTGKRILWLKNNRPALGRLDEPIEVYR